MIRPAERSKIILNISGQEWPAIVIDYDSYEDFELIRLSVWCDGEWLEVKLKFPLEYGCSMISLDIDDIEFKLKYISV